MNILLIDDHALFREGLQCALQLIDADIVIWEAGSFDSALEQLENNTSLDLVLIDLDLPVHNGFEVLSHLSKYYPTLPCVILSASTNRSDVDKALALGALGFISKSTKASVVHNALKLIMAGEVYVPYEIMHAERRSNTESRVRFTPRQLDVISLVTQGHPNKIIADKLNLSEATVKMHLTAVYEKLNVHNRTSAIAKLSQLNVGTF